MRRRDFLRRIAAAGTLAACAPALPAASPRRRLLCFTKSAGFQHSVVKRPADGSLSLVERTMTELGARNGFDVVCSKDGSLFTPAGLREFDALLFFTSGDLNLIGTDGFPSFPPGGKQALLDAVAGGKGFIGLHAATDNFHTPPDLPDRSNRYVLRGEGSDPFIRMIGAEFIKHGKPQPGRVRVIDPRFPGMDGFGAAEVVRHGEWYSLKDFAPDMHVLMVLDTAGMPDPAYQRGPYPVAWARGHGRGRVYYTALGHYEEEWAEPAFLGSLVGATRWAFGDAPADLSPNLPAAAPRFADMPPMG